MEFIHLNILTERSIHEDQYSSTIRSVELVERLKTFGYTRACVADYLTYSGIHTLIATCLRHSLCMLFAVKYPIRLMGFDTTVTLYPRDNYGLSICFLALYSGSISEELWTSKIQYSRHVAKVFTSDSVVVTRHLNMNLGRLPYAYFGLEMDPESQSAQHLMSEMTDVPVLAYPPVTTLEGMVRSRDILRSIKQNCRYTQISSEVTCALSPMREWLEKYAKYPVLIRNNERFFVLHQFVPQAIRPTVPMQTSNDEYALISYSMLGLYRRGMLNHANLSRLRYELSIVCSKGFASYFLLVKRITDYCHANNIIVGPRGSGAGALISYCLNITNIDPVRHGLFFERFINPARQDYPDYDIDLSSSGRQKVIHMLQEIPSYSVSHISTYNRMQGRMVLRSVGKSLGLSEFEIDNLSRYVQYSTVRRIRLQEVLDTNEDLQQLLLSDRKVLDVFENSLKLEGVITTYGVHAAGIAITSGSSSGGLPITDREGEQVILLDKDEIEYYGVLKLDLLGVDILSVLSHVEEVNGVRMFDISTEDSEVFDYIVRGPTLGLFQISHDNSNILKRIGVRSIGDIANVIAINRPGAMDYIEDYVRRSNGEPYEREQDDVLNDTFGIMIYQEQVMKIAILKAGYTPTEAEDLRKIISKKMIYAMPKERERFMTRAVVHGCTHEDAASLFSKIEKFQGYGFNMAHAYSYAYNTYYSAYCRYHYPLDYFSAVMNHEQDGLIRAQIFYEMSHKVRWTMDLNIAEWDTRVRNGELVLGLNLVKGMSQSLCERITSSREREGEFLSEEDVARRVVRNERERNLLTDIGVLKGSPRYYYRYGFDPYIGSLCEGLSLQDFVYQNALLGETQHLFRVKVLSKLNKRGAIYHNKWARTGNEVLVMSDGTYMLHLLTDLNLTKINLGETYSVLLYYPEGNLKKMRLVEVIDS